MLGLSGMASSFLETMKGTTLSHFISINSGIIYGDSLWITRNSYHLGNPKGFWNSILGNSDKGQIYSVLYHKNSMIQNIPIPLLLFNGPCLKLSNGCN
jgi:hypothetical protein